MSQLKNGKLFYCRFRLLIYLSRYLDQNQRRDLFGLRVKLPPDILSINLLTYLRKQLPIVQMYYCNKYGNTFGIYFNIRRWSWMSLALPDPESQKRAVPSTKAKYCGILSWCFLKWYRNTGSTRCMLFKPNWVPFSQICFSFIPSGNSKSCTMTNQKNLWLFSPHTGK